MRCDRCIENNEAHTVTPGIMTRTLMETLPGFWNEQNQWVEPADPNTTSVNYICSKGHRWSITSGGYLDEPRTTILKDARPPITEIDPSASGPLSRVDMLC